MAENPQIAIDPNSVKSTLGEHKANPLSNVEIDPTTITSTLPQQGTAVQKPEPSLLRQAGDLGVNALEGMGESALGAVSGTDDWARQHLPAFFTNSNFGFGKPADLANVKKIVTPDSDSATQQVFKDVGNVSQFFIPGQAEEVGAAKLASVLPKLKYVAPVAKTVGSALSSGAINKAQGGDFTTGALLGGVTRGAGEVGSAYAPEIQKWLGSFGKSHPLLKSIANPFGLGLYGAYKGFHEGDSLPDRVENSIKGGLEGAAFGMAPKIAGKAIANPQITAPLVYGILNQLFGKPSPK